MGKIDLDKIPVINFEDLFGNEMKIKGVKNNKIKASSYYGEMNGKEIKPEVPVKPKKEETALIKEDKIVTNPTEVSKKPRRQIYRRTK